MKRLATILMLVVTILVGGATIEAKTTSKKAKAKTTQTTSSSKINKLLTEYEEIVEWLNRWDYDESKKCYVGGAGQSFIEGMGEENVLFDKLTALKNSMNSSQKERFNKALKAAHRK